MVWESTAAYIYKTFLIPPKPMINQSKKLNIAVHWNPRPVQTERYLPMSDSVLNSCEVERWSCVQYLQHICLQIIKTPLSSDRSGWELSLQQDEDTSPCQSPYKPTTDLLTAIYNHDLATDHRSDSDSFTGPPAQRNGRNPTGMVWDDEPPYCQGKCWVSSQFLCIFLVGECTGCMQAKFKVWLEFSARKCGVLSLGDVCVSPGQACLGRDQTSHVLLYWGFHFYLRR